MKYTTTTKERRESNKYTKVLDKRPPLSKYLKSNACARIRVTAMLDYIEWLKHFIVKEEVKDLSELLQYLGTSELQMNERLTGINENRKNRLDEQLKEVNQSIAVHQQNTLYKLQNQKRSIEDHLTFIDSKLQQPTNKKEEDNE
tara:strand:+ start:69 stop:500 length:432 start_codon:yes stop_codon:yes gene_type:complete